MADRRRPARAARGRASRDRGPRFAGAAHRCAYGYGRLTWPGCTTSPRRRSTARRCRSRSTPDACSSSSTSRAGAATRRSTPGSSGSTARTKTMGSRSSDSRATSSGTRSRARTTRFSDSARPRTTLRFRSSARSRSTGRTRIPVHVFLKSQKKGLLGLEAIKWNFTKFLVGPDGEVLKRYGSADTPESIEKDLRARLSASPR